MMKVTIKLNAVVSLLLLAVLAVAAVGFSGAFSAKAESADKITTVFMDGETSGFLKNDFAELTDEGMFLLSAGEVTTENEMTHFLAVLNIGSISGGFEFVFGISGANRQSVKFDGAILRLSGGLTAISGATSIAMSDRITANSIVQFEYVSGMLAISIKKSGEPIEVLGTPIAELILENGKAPVEGKMRIAGISGGSVCVKSAKLYSLNSTIFIAPEHFVPPVIEPEENNNMLKTILLATLIPAGVLILGGAAALILIMRRKNNVKKVD